MKKIMIKFDSSSKNLMNIQKNCPPIEIHFCKESEEKSRIEGITKNLTMKEIIYSRQKTNKYIGQPKKITDMVGTSLQ